MKRILSTFKQKWPDYLLEALVIIIGVLGAFGLNNWNEQIKIDRIHKELISNLHEEFVNNLTSLNEQISRFERKIAACESLHVLFGTDLSTYSGPPIDDILLKTMDSPTWNPSTYVLTEMKNSGQIRVLRNEDLKRMLFEWDQHYENLKEWYQLEINFYEEYMDYIIHHGSFRNISKIEVQGSGSKSNFEIDNKDLLNDVVFESLNARNLSLARSLLYRYRNRTLVRMNEIIEETENLQ